MANLNDVQQSDGDVMHATREAMRSELAKVQSTIDGISEALRGTGIPWIERQMMHLERGSLRQRLTVMGYLLAAEDSQ